MIVSTVQTDIILYFSQDLFCSLVKMCAHMTVIIICHMWIVHLQIHWMAMMKRKCSNTCDTVHLFFSTYFFDVETSRISVWISHLASLQGQVFEHFLDSCSYQTLFVTHPTGIDWNEIFYWPEFGLVYWKLMPVICVEDLRGQESHVMNSNEENHYRYNARCHQYLISMRYN